MDSHGGDLVAARSHRHSFPPGAGGGGGGGREDCWSEGATAVLIEAWGERHLRCNRGNLRQTDWREVADAVNGRENGSKPRKTDVQCKNRIDTLKKKYKVEKAKPSASSWPFFPRMDYLIGPGNCSGKKSSPIPAVNLTVKQSNRFRLNSSGSSNPSPNPNHNPNFGANPNNLKGNWAMISGGSSSRLNYMGEDSSEGSMGGGEDEDEDDEDDERDDYLLLEGGGGGGGGGTGRKHRIEMADSTDEETAFRELARAILKFGEIYERIESSKQQQLMELERQRMEFTKDLEYQRMNMLMEAQIELQKLKRHKNSASAGKKV